MSVSLRIAVVLVGLTILAEGAAIIELARSRNATRDELAAIQSDRDKFCFAYRGMLRFDQAELSHAAAQSADINRMLYGHFRSLASSPYFELCHISAAPYAVDLNRADACLDAGDFSCVATIAARVTTALSAAQ